MSLPQQRLDNSQRPGHMTAAMRASVGESPARHGPKLLRIGVVHDGRIRDERTFRTPGNVRVGTDEANSFLLGGAEHPASFCLFERIGDAYHLNFTREMQGRVALRQGVFALNELCSDAAAISRGVYRVLLNEESRGKVALGDVTFLFHFVEASPVLPKPVLPVAVLRGEASVDWNSTLCAAVSFLLHFMILCAVYSDWADPVIDDDLSTAGLIDSLKSLPPPPPIEDKAVLDDAPRPAREERRASAAPKESRPTSSKGGSRSDQPNFSRVEPKVLMGALADIDLSIIGVLKKQGPATTSVLQRSEVALPALDAVARSGAGVGNGTDPRLPLAGAPIRAGTFPDFSSYGTKTRGPDEQGRVAVVKGPRAETTIAALSTSGGALNNAARVVAGMRAGFRNCYQRGLAENPDAGGSIKLTIRVGPGGEVLGVAAAPSGNLPATVVSCVQARAKAAQFDAPEGGAAVISVPVTFVKQ